MKSFWKMNLGCRTTCLQPLQVPQLIESECHAGVANPEHYIVATQEKALRQTLGGIPGGASVFASVNGLHIEPPSDAQRKAIEQAMTSRLATEFRSPTSCLADVYAQ